MLARSLRLRRQRDISSVYQRGRYATASNFQIKALANGLPHNRAAVVVSRKVTKSAVARNLSRRRISGALEGLWANLPTGFDLVITVRSEVDKLPAAALASELAKALGQALQLKTERQ